MKLLLVAVRDSDEFDRAFATMMSEHIDAFLMTSDPLHRLNVEKIIDFLVKNRLPGMFQEREIVVAGGFMSYGASVPDLFRRGALYVQRFCKAPNLRTCRSSSRSNSIWPSM